MYCENKFRSHYSKCLYFHSELLREIWKILNAAMISSVKSSVNIMSLFYYAAL